MAKSMANTNLIPIAFDVETSGFGSDAVVTVAGFCYDSGESLILNTGGRDEYDWGLLLNELDEHSDGTLELDIVTSEQELLELVASFVKREIVSGYYYFTAFDGETCNGEFDLPFCRSRYLHHDIPWPFSGLAYADTSQIVDGFATNGHSDLDGVYEALVSDDTFDPFDDNEEAVEAFENASWLPLLKHNLADIKRTHQLARLADAFVPESDFSMKNLQPPNP